MARTVLRGSKLAPSKVRMSIGQVAGGEGRVIANHVVSLLSN